MGEWFASLEGLGDIFSRVVGELNSFGVRFDNPRLFNPEYLKFIWQLMAREAGVDVLFHSSICGVKTDSKRLMTVQIAACSTLLTARAQYFVDATGEGDLGALAGASFVIFMNATKVMGHDPTDPFSLSAAETDARIQLLRVAHYLQVHEYPTYALAASGATIGIREGRRLQGDYFLTREEVLDRQSPLTFADGVSTGKGQSLVESVL